MAGDTAPDQQTDRDSTYEEAGMTNELGFGDAPAVVVVDLQTGFTDPESPLGSELDDVVASTARLLETAHEYNVPTYLTRCVYREDLKDGGVFTEKVPTAEALAGDSAWLDIDHRIPRDESDHLIDKQMPSAFFDTNLDSMLTAEGVDTLVVAGATTSGCVRATVVDACSYGYRPMVPTECVGDRAQEPHDANLFDMGSKYADLMDLETVERDLRRTSSH